jgi:hypothetical protein
MNDRGVMSEPRLLDVLPRGSSKYDSWFWSIVFRREVSPLMVVGEGSWTRLLRGPKSLGCLVIVESVAYRNTRQSFRGPILVNIVSPGQ